MTIHNTAREGTMASWSSRPENFYQ